MAKKKEKVDEVDEVEESEENHTDTPEKVSISPVTADFGRADLNQLRDVLNQLIARS